MNDLERSAADLVVRYQAASAALRAVYGRRDRGDLTGRNGEATQRTIEYHSDRMVRIERDLTARGDKGRGLAGELHAWHDLSERIRQSRFNGITRPELSARQRAARRMITGLLEDAEAVPDRAPVTLIQLVSADRYRAVCECGFVGHVETEEVAALDRDGHALTEHGIRTGSLEPRTPSPARCDNCRRPVSDQQAAKYEAVDWVDCPACERETVRA